MSTSDDGSDDGRPRTPKPAASKPSDVFSRANDRRLSRSASQTPPHAAHGSADEYKPSDREESDLDDDSDEQPEKQSDKGQVIQFSEEENSDVEGDKPEKRKPVRKERRVRDLTKAPATIQDPGDPSNHLSQNETGKPSTTVVAYGKPLYVNPPGETAGVDTYYPAMYHNEAGVVAAGDFAVHQFRSKSVSETCVVGTLVNHAKGHTRNMAVLNHAGTGAFRKEAPLSSLTVQPTKVGQDGTPQRCQQLKPKLWKVVQQENRRHLDKTLPALKRAIELAETNDKIRRDRAREANEAKTARAEAEAEAKAKVNASEQELGQVARRATRGAKRKSEKVKGPTRPTATAWEPGNAVTIVAGTNYGEQGFVYGLPKSGLIEVQLVSDEGLGEIVRVQTRSAQTHPNPTQLQQLVDATAMTSTNDSSAHTKITLPKTATAVTGADVGERGHRARTGTDSSDLGGDGKRARFTAADLETVAQRAYASGVSSQPLHATPPPMFIPQNPYQPVTASLFSSPFAMPPAFSMSSPYLPQPQAQYAIPPQMGAPSLQKLYKDLL